jgi:CRP-like cAMP-binding protein
MPVHPSLQISRFEPFSALSRSELDLVAEHARRILIPRRRWLLRPGRELRGHHFLLKGSVATVEPPTIVVAGQPAASKPVYPGSTGLRTLSDCEFLQVPAVVFDLLDARVESPLIVVREAVDCWQSRFLGSELMARLPPAVWQLLLRRLKPRALPKGAWIIREGESAADCCFVLTSGTARVLCSDRVVNRLEPGDLFGEDELITGEPRNASVRMDSDGQVMAMSAGDFREFLARALLEGVFAEPTPSDCHGPRALVRFGSSRNLRERISRLATDREYLVSSGIPEVESLAIFLMRKRGLSAWSAPGVNEAKTLVRP